MAAACDDEQPQKAPSPRSLTKGELPLEDIRWLQVKDKASPSDWLASREAASGASPDRASAAREISTILADADQRYYEGPRMIANRAVQIEEMLRENGAKESARSIIVALASIADTGEHAGFGETCQHYVTARIQGVSRDDALKLLQGKGLPGPVEGDER